MSSSTLYVVATPIGNLEDITYRAVRALGEADLIAAEDTRVSRVLLEKYGIRKPVFSCHKFNEERQADFFAGALAAGKSIALISDAGTPCISDPGHRLVSMARSRGFAVASVCGPSSVAAALSVSGFPADSFCFAGFLPKGAACGKKLAEMAARGGTFVFFESPRRIKKALDAMPAETPVCLCNDLSKKYERVYTGTARRVLAMLEENPCAEKGEYTCVARFAERAAAAESGTLAPSVPSMLVDIMHKEGVGLKAAMAALRARGGGFRKKTVYDAGLALKEMFDCKEDEAEAGL